MTNIEKLLIKRAQLVKQIKDNKADSACGVCEHIFDNDNFSSPLRLPIKPGLNCIERAYKMSREISTPYDFFSFNETFHDLLGEDGKPACEHCLKVIRNKRARALLGRKIAGVNAALTRIGQRLERESI